jgi:hypothetical protein
MQSNILSRGENPLKSKILSMLSDSEVRQKVTSKLESSQITQAILKLEVKNSKTDGFKIEEADVRKVFDCFGEVLSLDLDDKVALIKYKDIVSAYFALTVLNGKELPELNVVIEVAWFTDFPVDPRVEPESEPKPSLPQETKQEAETRPEARPEVRPEPRPEKFLAKAEPVKKEEDENLKYTCRFDIQINNDKDFQVARRIIGSKGVNMKRIIDKCCKGLNGRVHDLVKLRLRGKGSGFKEGPNNTESQDSLHLCISSKYQNNYLVAVVEIERLLRKVYQEFNDYCFKIGLPRPNLQVLKVERVSGRSAVISPSRVAQLEAAVDVSEDDIEDLIDVRNEARRQCNFAEADRIRELLRKKGVILMDEKGGRGRGTEVTNWKYSKI